MAALLPTLLSLLIKLHNSVLALFSLVVGVAGVTNSTNSSYGPNSHPLIGSFIAFYRNRCRLLDWYTDLLAASPSQTVVVTRLGARRTVVTANPDNVEHILKTNFCNYPKGKPFTDILGDLLGCGIFNADGDLWLAQRKLASHEFTARSLRELLYSALESEADGRLLPFLTSACDDGRAVDLQDVLRRFAFDVICKISLGTDLGLLGPSSELTQSPFADAFEAASLVSAQRGSAPVFAVWKAKRALGIGSERRLRESVGLIHNTVTGIIQQRKLHLRDDQMQEGKNNNDLLSRLIAGGHGDEATRDMAISFIMAGRDTTSSALTWFFWLLTRHPAIETELVQEISTHNKLDYYQLKELKLLEACLYESMRLYPPVAWDSKHAEGGDTLPDGTQVKSGDRVTYFPYGMGRMERIWGKDWEEFRPDRWFSKNSSEMIKVSAYKYPVFQGGPRVCLGKEMAFVQMKFVAAAVLSRFNVRRADGREGTPKVVPLLTAHMAGGMPVVLTKRRAGA